MSFGLLRIVWPFNQFLGIFVRMHFVWFWGFCNSGMFVQNHGLSGLVLSVKPFCASLSQPLGFESFSVSLGSLNNFGVLV